MLEKRKVRRIEEVTKGFGFGLIQDVVTLANLLFQHDIKIDDLEDYINYKKDQEEKESVKEEAEIFNRHERERKLWEKVAPKCPDCGDILSRPRKLCGKEKASNKEGWSCLWYCIKGWNEDEPSGICGWEKYTHENAMEVTRDLMRGKIDGYNIP